MFWYFKESKALALGIFFLGILISMILLTVLNPNETHATIIFALSVFFWFTLSLAFTWIYGNMKMNKIDRILTEECDPQKYIFKIDQLLGRKKNKKYYDTRLLIAKSTGLLSVGRTADAGEILRNIQQFPDNIIGRLDKIIYFNNLFLVYLANKEFDKAVTALKYMEEAIEKSKLHDVSKEIYQRLYLQKKHLFHIEMNDYENSEAVFSMMLEKASSKMEKVSAMIVLGRIHLHNGKTNEAKAAFEYVIHNGNRLSKTVDAKNYLSNI